MDELKIKQLSSSISDFSIDNLDFSARVRAGHLFTSIEECIQYLSYIVYNKNPNPDDPTFKSMTQYPVLYANIIDEAITSITRDSYEFIRKKDNDAIGYYRVSIDKFMMSIILEQNTLDLNDRRNNVLNALWVMLSKISVILNPTDHAEELTFGSLALYYYNLMFTVYTYLAHESSNKEYLTKCKKLYTKYLNASYNKK